jgi:hypothetical protein
MAKQNLNNSLLKLFVLYGLTMAINGFVDTVVENANFDLKNPLQFSLSQR